jgi:hypothetical protein
MMRIFALLVWIGMAAPLAALTQTAQATGLAVPAYHDASDLDCQLYAAYLEKNYKPAKNDGPLARSVLLIENESVDAWYKNRRAWEAFLSRRASGPGRASDACIQAFLARPQQTLRFFKFPATIHALKFVRSDELLGVLRGGWDAFYARYPGASGILSFSVVGWGPAYDEALFTVHSQCGRRCGYRDLVYMQRINGAWEIVLKESLP